MIGRCPCHFSASCIHLSWREHFLFICPSIHSCILALRILGNKQERESELVSENPWENYRFQFRAWATRNKAPATIIILTTKLGNLRPAQIIEHEAPDYVTWPKQRGRRQQSEAPCMVASPNLCIPLASPAGNCWNSNKRRRRRQQATLLIRINIGGGDTQASGDPVRS